MNNTIAVVELPVSSRRILSSIFKTHMHTKSAPTLAQKNNVRFNKYKNYMIFKWVKKHLETHTDPTEFTSLIHEKLF